MAIAALGALAAAALSKPGTMAAIGSAIGGLAGKGKRAYRRRRRMLTQADKNDIMFLVNAVGKANAARFAAMRVR